MKKEYLAPEFELTIFSFESILQQATVGLNVSNNENGGSDYNDNDDGDW